ncbi:MAG: hypothetical protein CBC48_19455 [bacterium TMED88]|nr:hypothetical protein [Deltaproteobacteria bacterium]OUV22656.1 MAG: hypothetical protein CBC48_19455 [bacterium TMED88]
MVKIRVHLLFVLLAVSVSLSMGTGCQPSQTEPAAPVDLQAAAKSVFSQFGEDGVIEKIFEVIEPGPKFAVEFGAYDGVTNSNMRNLVVNKGWSSFQIEGDEQRAAQLADNYADYPGTRTLNAWVWPGNVEILFEENGVPKDLDFLVVDIDSNDYYIWRMIREFRPKVVMIEVNMAFAPPEKMVIDYHPMNYWDLTYYTGASIVSMTELAKEKGYEIVYCMEMPSPNCFFVERQYFDLFGIEDNSPEAMYQRPVPAAFNRPEWKWGRDGMPWPPGKDKLSWKNLKIEKKFIFDR